MMDIILKNTPNIELKRPSEWWDRWFLEKAEHTSSGSKDPSTKVGAIIVDANKRLISEGFNGLPKKVIDNSERLYNRDTKLKLIIHAEINAIIFAQRPLEGFTLYTWPFMPCSACASVIINSGITRVVAPNYFPERWKESFALSKDLFKEAGVEFFIIDL